MDFNFGSSQLVYSLLLLLSCLTTKPYPRILLFFTNYMKPAPVVKTAYVRDPQITNSIAPCLITTRFARIVYALVPANAYRSDRDLCTPAFTHRTAIGPYSIGATRRGSLLDATWDMRLNSHKTGKTYERTCVPLMRANSSKHVSGTGEGLARCLSAVLCAVYRSLCLTPGGVGGPAGPLRISPVAGRN